MGAWAMPAYLDPRGDSWARQVDDMNDGSHPSTMDAHDSPNREPRPRTC